MPGPVQQADKLHRRTITAYQQMRRHRHTGNGFEIGVCGRVKLIAEKPLDGIATELSRRQTDVMNNQQRNPLAIRARAEIRRRAPSGPGHAPCPA